MENTLGSCSLELPVGYKPIEIPDNDDYYKYCVSNGKWSAENHAFLRQPEESQQEYVERICLHHEKVKAEKAAEEAAELAKVKAEIAQRKQGLSFIEPHEEQAAKEFVAKHLNELGLDKPLPAAGWKMVVKIYIRPEEISTFVDEATGETKSLVIPSMMTAHDKYVSCVGLVVSQGPDCYKGEKFKESGPWCKVGDFVVFPKNHGYQMSYNNVAIKYIDDVGILGTIDDPAKISFY